MKKTTRDILIVATLVIALDQLSKYLAAAAVPPGGAWSPFSGENPVLQIVHATSTGAAFGLFKGLGLASIVMALIVAGVVAFYARKLRNDQWLTSVSLGLMLGGATGNVIDRMRLGHVIDFIDAGIGATRWTTSNLADVAIVLGVIVLGLATLLDERKHKQRQRVSAAGEAAASGVME